MFYSRVVIILVNMGLYKSAFPTFSFEDLVFHLSVFCIFYFFCFEIDVIFKDFQNLSN